MCIGVRRRGLCMYRECCALCVQLSSDQQGPKSFPIERRSSRTFRVSPHVSLQSSMHFGLKPFSDTLNSRSGSSSDASLPSTNVIGRFLIKDSVSTISCESPTVAPTAAAADDDTGANFSLDLHHRPQARFTLKNSLEALMTVPPSRPLRRISQR